MPDSAQGRGLTGHRAEGTIRLKRDGRRRQTAGTAEVTEEQMLEIADWI